MWVSFVCEPDRGSWEISVSVKTTPSSLAYFPLPVCLCVSVCVFIPTSFPLLFPFYLPSFLFSLQSLLFFFLSLSQKRMLSLLFPDSLFIILCLCVCLCVCNLTANLLWQLIWFLFLLRVDCCWLVSGFKTHQTLTHLKENYEVSYLFTFTI